MPRQVSSADYRRPAWRSPRNLLDNGTFKALPELYEWNAAENPDYPLFTYHDGAALNVIDYAEANMGIRRAARYVLSRIAVASDPRRRTVVGVLAMSDTITFFCTTMGISRAGHTFFLISPRNGPAGVADMLKRTECTHLLVSEDPTMQSLAQAAHDLLSSDSATPAVNLHRMPRFEDLFPPSDASREAFKDNCAATLPVSFDDPDAVVMILHSSGSTGHPKPIRWRQHWSLRFGRFPWHDDIEDVTGRIMACHGTPMFHAMGALFYSFAPSRGVIMATFKPTFPATIPTPDRVFEGAKLTASDYVVSAPAFIEQWVRNPHQVEYFAKTRGIMFGGAPLTREAGNLMAGRGVAMHTLYGTTETGALTVFPRTSNPGMDWEYLELNKWNNVVAIPSTEDNLLEVVVLSDPKRPLPAPNAKVDGRDAYATNDLVERHPTNPNLYRIYGRSDDQIILSNGEKTNPIPLELIITEDPCVRACIIFGRGKFQNGVLIQPSETLGNLPLESFRSKIWPSIERANEYAPQHSRIFKEMILLTSPDKPFIYNMKGLPKRRVILPMYQEEIDALYRAVEDSAQCDIEGPLTWDAEGVLEFVRAVVSNVMVNAVADDADLFRNGCDSLQATWIRNTILRALREASPAAAKRLPMNIIFQAPSILALADAVVQTFVGATATPGRTAEDLVKLADKLSSDLPARPPSLRPRSGSLDVVVITGTTGGFGCDVLAHLLNAEDVGAVYAFNRPGTDAMGRQRARFRERGLEEQLLLSPKFRMVEAELHVPGFGLPSELLNEIRESVTHIMHNAWKVNFNMALSSFDMDLRATRNLIDLAVTSPFTVPPKVMFVSSIGIFANYAGPIPVPEAPIEPHSAVGYGYSEAKWIAERLLQNVSAKTGLATTAVRLGQIAGDRLGYWNESEWFPTMIKSALFQRCLPDLEGDAAFFLAHEAALAFLEMRTSSSPVLHLTHPRPVPWHTIIAPIAGELGVPLVPYSEWVAALQRGIDEESASAVELMKDNPALRLLDFFRTQTFHPDKEPLGFAPLDTTKAAECSETFTKMPQLDADIAKRWVAAWRRSGFLPQ